MGGQTQQLKDQNSYAGLEVAPSNAPVAVNPDHSGLQIAPSGEPPFAVAQHSELEVLPNQDPVHDYDNAEKFDASPPRAGKRRKLCGLRPVIFWLLLVLAVVVLGGAIGGGVGGGLAAQGPMPTSGPAEAVESLLPAPPAVIGIGDDVASSSSSSQRLSSSSATSSAVTSGTTGIAAYDCANGSFASTSSNSQYKQFCRTDWPYGYGTFDGSPSVEDVQYLTTYSFEACMNACDAHNVKSGGACRALTYNSNLTWALEFSGGNCVLKSARADTDVSSETCASAFLVD